ncbi:MAG: ROK family transcriptional regulator [Acidiferrobacterales bacterium]|nr:ROK family transcriptional regulator [Acidiferrobacterales bacterium]
MITAIRQAGALSKAEIARTTGLSGQAATVIVNALIEEGLLIKLKRVRGHVGKPFTPIALNPKGAFSVGVKIGRRSLETILVNFHGNVIASRTERYDAPLPVPTMTAAIKASEELIKSVESRLQRRIVGLGVAMPWDLHEWSDVLGLQSTLLENWRNIDVVDQFESSTGLAVSLFNDATAACAAEMIAGDRIRQRSAMYFFLGTFVGGGVVIEARLFRGDQINAGAVGSMPMSGTDSEGRPSQLIHLSSAIELERSLASAGIDVSDLFNFTPDDAAETIFEQWMHRMAPALAHAIISATSVIDFQEVVIDGILCPAWRKRIVETVSAECAKFNHAGLSPFEISIGTIGPSARVLGAALMPLMRRFSPDTDLLTKTGRTLRTPEAALTAEPQSLSAAMSGQE